MNEYFISGLKLTDHLKLPVVYSDPETNFKPNVKREWKNFDWYLKTTNFRVLNCIK